MQASKNARKQSSKNASKQASKCTHTSTREAILDTMALPPKLFKRCLIRGHPLVDQPDVGDRRSAITLLKTHEPTKRALIQTGRGEIDYGERNRHVFVKSMFSKYKT